MTREQILVALERLNAALPPERLPVRTRLLVEEMFDDGT
jgi:hypothetical protein